jgi:hypothetical protein
MRELLFKLRKKGTIPIPDYTELPTIQQSLLRLNYYKERHK